MAKLKSLKLQGFRSFVQEQTVVFPPSGLVLVRGNNPITGDASGAGKSTIALAIAYAFDYCPYSATELQSWLTETPMQIELTADTTHGEVVICRGKKNSISVNGVVTTGAKAIAEKMTAIFGHTKILRPLTYREQNSRGFFLGLTDSNKKDFLTEVLGLDKIESAIALAEDNIRFAADAQKVAVASVAVASGTLSASRNAMIEKPSLDIQQHEANAVQTNNDITSLVKQIEDLNQEVKRLNTQFANGIGAQVCELYGKIGGLDSQLVDIKKEENQALASKPNLLEAEQMIARAREKIKAITKEDQEKNAKRIEVTNTRRKALKIIDERLFNIKRANETLKEKSVQFELVGQSTCPTCTRVWDNEESRTKLQKLELECNELKMLVGTESGLLLERDSVLLELDDLAKIIKNPDIDKWIEAERKCSDSLKSIMAKHSEEIGVVIAGLSDKKKDLVEKKAVLVQTINALKNSSSSEADRLSDQIAEKERELTALRQSLLVLQNTTLQYDKDMQNYDRQLSAVKQQETALAALQNDLATATTQLNMERDFVDMVGRNGFLGLIFDEVLAEIATEANSRLAKLANVSGVTIRFDSEVTTQAGTTKRSITPVISIGGHEAKLNSGLSGGMLTSVEQVVDLAVMEVVQRRTGNIPGWLILDEAFNGQGMATKESCMEVLGEYAKDKTILVIDHASEFKEMFTQFIDVESFNGFSTIK